MPLKSCGPVLYPSRSKYGGHENTMSVCSMMLYRVGSDSTSALSPHTHTGCHAGSAIARCASLASI
jgi:hypothetical protein